MCFANSCLQGLLPIVCECLGEKKLGEEVQAGNERRGRSLLLYEMNFSQISVTTRLKSLEFGEFVTHWPVDAVAYSVLCVFVLVCVYFNESCQLHI